MQNLTEDLMGCSQTRFTKRLTVSPILSITALINLLIGTTINLKGNNGNHQFMKNFYVNSDLCGTTNKLTYTVPLLYI